MAFSCSTDGPLVKSVSPITLSPLVRSTMMKLSELTDRRLTASAGYDSWVHCHCSPAFWTNPSSLRIDSISCTLNAPKVDVEVNGNSNAAHFT